MVTAKLLLQQADGALFCMSFPLRGFVSMHATALVDICFFKCLMLVCMLTLVNFTGSQSEAREGT